MKKKKRLEQCPLCRAPLVSHNALSKTERIKYLWCSKNPSHFRWEVTS